MKFLEGDLEKELKIKNEVDLIGFKVGKKLGDKVKNLEHEKDSLNAE